MRRVHLFDAAGGRALIPAASGEQHRCRSVPAQVLSVCVAINQNAQRPVIRQAPAPDVDPGDTAATLSTIRAPRPIIEVQRMMLIDWSRHGSGPPCNWPWIANLFFISACGSIHQLSTTNLVSRCFSRCALACRITTGWSYKACHRELGPPCYLGPPKDESLGAALTHALM